MVFFLTSSETIFCLFWCFSSKRLLCDVVIVAETVEMEAHRVVLAACSPYFCAMFTGTLQQTLHWGTVNGPGSGIRLWGSMQNIAHRKVTMGLGLLWVVFFLPQQMLGS